MSDDSQELVDEWVMETSNDDQELVDEWVMEIEGRLDNSHATRRPSMYILETCPSIIGNWQCTYLKQILWSYYHGVDQFRTAENSKRFIEHLLVNSCFLIFGMILLSGENKLEHRWLEIINKDNPKGLTGKDIQNIKDFIRLEPSGTQDYMLTMNYQIPWFVVEAVYTELSNISKFFVTPTYKIVYLFCRGFYPAPLNKIDGGGTVPEDGFKHLLHIFHWSRTTDRMYVVDTTVSRVIGKFNIPSATELQLSQTRFINNESVPIDVSYSDGRIYGVLQLTPWHLFNYSPKLYESLLRFEGLYGLRCGLPFSSYVTCMANLVKTEEDVKVLRANDIIPGTSFDNKNVLRTVHELKTSIADDLRLPNELVNLMEKVMTHHKKSVYRGEFKKRYCSNTWIIVSVVTGICLFVLTFIQTVLSFIQTKYSVLSYKQQ